MTTSNSKKVNTAVLIVGRNRPEYLQRLLNLKAIQNCGNIFIFLDGPEVKTDLSTGDEKLRYTQQIAKDFVTEQQGKLLISNSQLGCYRGVTTAIDWFFSHVDEGIILEDDLMLHDDALLVAEKALNQFREDLSIASICLYRIGKSDNSYNFTISEFTSSWGWATWKNRWLDFDHSSEKKLLFHPLIVWKHGGIRGIRRWHGVMKRLRKGELDSWGYRWLFSVWLRRKLNAVSPYNLVANRGFGEHATHTKSGESNNIDKSFEWEKIDWTIDSKEANTVYDRLLLERQFGIKYRW